MLRARFLALALSMAAAPGAFAQTLVPSDLTFSVFQGGLNSPSAAEFLPDGRLVIIQLGGGIRVRPAAGGALINAGTIPVVTSIGEQGLLGLAIDPQFATSNRLYFYYSEPGSPDTNRHRVAWTTINPTTSNISGSNTITLVSLVNNLTQFTFMLRNNYTVSSVLATASFATYNSTLSSVPCWLTRTPCRPL